MEPAKRVGRYVLFGEIASGGMATVHYGRQFGSAGFARIVAIKRLHPHLAKDPDFSAMFLDEARIAARVRHPNVVPTIDVVSLPEGELLLVMEHVLGESLSRLMRRVREHKEHVPPEIVAGIICEALHGLHAAHEAKSEKGEALGIIHRDVSPHNILVGGDGITRIVDFGVAKARGRIHATRDGQVKGKLSYMAPEQLRGKPIDRRCDVFSAGVVMWEALTATRLFGSDSEGETVTRVLEAPLIPPSQVVASLPRALDPVVLKALAREPSKRFDTARDMAAAIEAVVPVANARAVAAWIQGVAGETLAERAHLIAELERHADPEAVVTSVVDEPPHSQISSVSVTSDAMRPRRAPYVALGALALAAAIGAGAFYASNRAKRVEAPPVASVAPNHSVAPIVSASSEAASATAPVASVAPAASHAEAEPHRRSHHVAHVAPPPTASVAPVDSERCPIKTFTDADGIVRFRRDCSP
ncbi:MAG TPA: serine/threonine-protein kinase [Polyangiaceae bacterium]